MTDTLAGRASHLLEVKHSRFLAQAAPVATPDNEHENANAPAER